MKPDIQARFTETMLMQLAARYGLMPENLIPLDGFESFIYQFNRSNTEYILRVGHSSRRGTPYVRGEVDWINHLAAGGASIAAAVHSEQDNLVETIADGQGEQFVAAAFYKVPGVSPSEFGWSPELYSTYGRCLGKMHALTTSYQPSGRDLFRPQWDHTSIMDVEENLSTRDPAAWKAFEALEKRCRNLPRDRDGFGLIHFDAHAGNFLVESVDQIHIFDFDDCNYNWFAYDIAIVLFYMVMWEKDKPAFTRAFLKNFFQGYRQEYRLDPIWLDTIPMFMKMREIDLYGVIHRDFDVNNLDHPWVAGFMDGRKEKIHAEIPFIDMDFSEFAGWL